MKRLLLSLFLVSASLIAFSQSKSYLALQNHFGGRKEVYSFGLSGFLCRAGLNIALHDEPLLRSMMKEIKHVRFIVIPKEEFKKQNLSVQGFKEYLSKDSFVSLATVRDQNDHVSIFHRIDDNKKDRYFVLVEEQREVVAIEMKGYIDPSLLANEDNWLTGQQR